MIRRQPTRTELNLDSLTDTMTNMVGMILLLVVGTVLISGGMKLQLLSELAEPGPRKPVYLVCKDGRVLFMHNGDQWKREMEQICNKLASRLKRKPTTSEALLECNRRHLTQTGDFQTTLVRETTREQGQDVYVIGIRFLPRGVKAGAQQAPTFSPAAKQAIEQADPATKYVDAFVYESGFDALQALQAKAKERKLPLGWRPILEHQSPGLSDTGVAGVIGGEE